MPPSGDHMEDLSGKQQFAERILRREAGDRANLRADFLFTFDNLVWAKRYFIGKDSRTLYELEVDEADIIHSADMMLFNAIADHGQDDEQAKEHASRYWQSDRGKGDKVEHICKAAKVTKVLYTPGEKDALKAEIYGLKRAEHDDAEFYANLFNQVMSPESK